MSPLPIGRLNRRLALEQVTRTPDGAGGVTESWSEVVRLWANVRALGGGEIADGDRVTGRISHEILIRYRDGVSPRQRFKFGNSVFHIVAVLDEGRAPGLRCLCEARDL